MSTGTALVNVHVVLITVYFSKYSSVLCTSCTDYSVLQRVQLLSTSCTSHGVHCGYSLSQLPSCTSYDVYCSTAYLSSPSGCTSYSGITGTTLVNGHVVPAMVYLASTPPSPRPSCTDHSALQQVQLLSTSCTSHGVHCTTYYTTYPS